MTRAVRVSAGLGVAVALALLVATAQPASAALGVVSNHETFGTGSQGEPAPASLTNMKIQGSGEGASVQMDGGTSFSPSNPGGDKSAFAGDEWGILINPNQQLTNLELTLNSVTTGSTVEIQDHGSGALIASTSATGGDTVQFTGLSLSPGTTYRVVATSGSSWTASTSGSGSVNLPLTGSAFDLTAGYSTPFGTRGDRVHVFNSVSTDTKPATTQYVGANHTVTGAQQGRVNLTLNSATADIEWQEYSGGSWSTVATDSASSSGVVATSLPQSSVQTYRVVVDGTTQSGSTTLAIESEGVAADVAAPSISSFEPDGGAQVKSDPQTVNATISDADFGTRGDSLTVEAVRQEDSTTIGSTTISSNQTASFSYSAVAGSNTIEWTVTDSYGVTTTKTQQFTTPAKLEVRNETQPRNLVSGSGGATVTFFADNTVEERSITSGTVRLDGLPADEEFVAVLSVDGYQTRRVVIPSLFEQQKAYLLPDNANIASIVFVLDDRTGRFPAQQTRLTIEKPITVNGTTEYRAIAADTFGGSGEFAISLQDNARYRLRVNNQDGRERVLGSYTTAGDDSATLPIGDVALGSTTEGGQPISASFEQTEQRGRVARVTYLDEAQTTDQLDLTLQNATGNTTFTGTFDDGPYGEFRTTIPVNNSTTRSTLNFTISRTVEGETLSRSGTIRLGEVPRVATDWPIDDQVLSLISWVGVFALFGLTLIWDERLSTIVLVGSASLLYAIGALQIPGGPIALGLAGVVAVLANVGRDGGGR